MTVTKVYYKHRNVTFRIHEASKKLRENYMRQRALMRAQHIRQLEDEKAVVMSRIKHVQHGAREAFLRMRLQAIEQQLKNENSGY